MPLPGMFTILLLSSSWLGRVGLSDFFKGREYVVALAHARLVLEARAHSLEYVVAVQVAPVGDVIDRDAWVHEDAELVGPFAVLPQQLVICDLSLL